MDLESAQNIVVNGNSFNPVPRILANTDGTSTSTISGLVTSKEKAQKKNDVKARSMLLIALLLGIHFTQYKDAKTLFEAIQARFSGNEAIKKTQKTLLKQMYENFNAPSTESLDFIFNKLQKIVCQLAILGENIYQEDLNMKFLRSLPTEWNTHVVDWRNKPDLETMSFDYLYNNFKIVKKEVKRTVVSSSSSGSLNMAFLSSPNSTNEVDTASIQVSTASTLVSTVRSSNNTTNLNKIHVDDLEEMDLKWQLALLSMRARRWDTLQGSEEVQGVKKAMIRATWVMMRFQPTWLLWLSQTQSSGLEEFKQLEFESYGHKDSKSVCVDTSNVIKKVSYALIIEDWVFDCDVDESEEVVKSVNTVYTNEEKSVTSVVGKQRTNDVKSSACWVWRPKIKIQDHVSKKSGSYICKRFDYVDPEGRLNSETSPFSYTIKNMMEDLFLLQAVLKEMCDKINSVLFTETECLILSPDFKLPSKNKVLRKVPRKNNMYSFDLKNVVPSKGLTCLFEKATNDESNLWHRRLGHINFKIMNKLMKGNLVRGLPLMIFENDHTFFACQKGKQHKASSKKDETIGILKDFITGIENQLNYKVKIIRCDNGTEFKNYEINQFCVIKGIKREFSNARTLKQNGVAERKNRTLLEAARTRSPIISFMRPFGCPVTILNTLDHLGKFDGKADEGFLVGSGPEWLFDIDSLTNLMNYQPVNAGNRTNGIAGSKIHFDAGQEGKEKMSDQEYILLPMLNKSSNVPSSNKEVESSPKDDAGKKSIIEPTCFEGGKIDDLECLDQQMKSTNDSENINSTNSFNTASPIVNTASDKDGTFQRTYGEWNFSTPIPVNAVGSSYSHPVALDDFSKTSNLEDTGIFDDAYNDKDEGVEANYNNLDTLIPVSLIPSIRIHKDHPKNKSLEK
nr:hypothetical protein [Tanacetum cinerariifolium]